MRSAARSWRRPQMTALASSSSDPGHPRRCQHETSADPAPRYRPPGRAYLWRPRDRRGRRLAALTGLDDGRGGPRPARARRRGPPRGGGPRAARARRRASPREGELMGIYSRLQQAQLRAADPGLDDRYYQDSFGGAWQYAETFAGFPVDPDMAMRVSTVFACNSLIAETLASLPCVLYRRLDNGGKEKATDHRVYWTLRYRPNSWMTAMDFFTGRQMDMGLRGNGLAEIIDDGREMSLLPLKPKYPTLERLGDNRFRYKVQNPAIDSQPRYLTQERVLHVRDLSDDGFVGTARAALARE